MTDNDRFYARQMTLICDILSHMSKANIICKATSDTFMRFGVLLVALWGFGLYFFYDAESGYASQNEAYFSYQAFEKGGAKAQQMSESEWLNAYTPYSSLIDASMVDGVLCVIVENEEKTTLYPLPPHAASQTGMPEEYLNYQQMRKSWNEAWVQYSSRMRYALKPHDPHDAASIAEQWVAGGVAFALSFILLFFTIRTRRRCLSIIGSTLTVAGHTFDVADIERLDMRQWGPGYKGAAIFTVKGKKIKADGMTYGGFDAKKNQPAEQFMQAVLAQYKGEVIEYATEETTKHA